MNIMVTSCECLTIKRYGDAWRCMICYKQYAPGPVFRSEPEPEHKTARVLWLRFRNRLTRSK